MLPKRKKKKKRYKQELVKILLPIYVPAGNIFAEIGNSGKMLGLKWCIERSV